MDDDGVAHLDPVLPSGWSRLVVPLEVRGARLVVTVTDGGTQVAAVAQDQPTVTVELRGERHELAPGGVTPAR